MVDDIPSFKRRLIRHNPSLRLNTGPYMFEREIKGLELLKRAYAAMSPSERAAVDAIDDLNAFRFGRRTVENQATTADAFDSQSAAAPAPGAPHEGQIEQVMECKRATYISSQSPYIGSPDQR
jgi:hypothetical protein